MNHFLKIYSVKINSPLLHKCSALLTSHTSYLMLFDTKHERLQNSFVKLGDDLLPSNGKTCFAFVNTSGKRSVCEKLLKVCSRLLQAQKWLLINSTHSLQKVASDNIIRRRSVCNGPVRTNFLFYFAKRSRRAREMSYFFYPF